VTRVVTEQAPSAKPVSISFKVTDQWTTIIDVPDYDVPVVGFGTTRRVAPGVAEISSPLMISNANTASDNISVRIIRSERYIANAQTHVAYDNAASNGTFTGGTGHVNNDVITLDNNATVRVDANSSGVVTQFTITNPGIRIYRDGTAQTTIQQFSTTGLGENFKLVARENNYDANDGIYFLTNDYPVEPRDTMIIPLNGQFFLTGDRLQVKASANNKLIVTISYTEGQSEEDDVFTGL